MKCNKMILDTYFDIRLDIFLKRHEDISEDVIAIKPANLFS